MAYDWTQLTEKEITNLYLYGTPSTPGELVTMRGYAQQMSRVVSAYETLRII